MNLKQLEAFIKVSDSKSFSKAAQELYLTQPTVSAHIQTLEKELKVRLFVRNTKTVKLSEDGKTLYQYARQMIELEQEIQSMFSKAAEQKERCITIATSTIPAQYILPENSSVDSNCQSEASASVYGKRKHRGHLSP